MKNDGIIDNKNHTWVIINECYTTSLGTNYNSKIKGKGIGKGSTEVMLLLHLSKWAEETGGKKHGNVKKHSNNQKREDGAR